MNGRERFEKWAESKQLVPTLYMWMAWQAALSAATPPEKKYQCMKCGRIIKLDEAHTHPCDSVKGEGEIATKEVMSTGRDIWPDKEPAVTGGHRAETSAAAPDVEELAREIEKIIELHETNYWQIAEGRWGWSCKCGEPQFVMHPKYMVFQNRDECAGQTRKHWAIQIAALLRARGERWIPVSERLPENDDWVIVWKEKSSSEPTLAYYDSVVTEWVALAPDWNAISPTHWRPLPAPPREGEGA